MTTSRTCLRVVLLMCALTLTPASSISAADLQPGVNQWIDANGVSLRYQLTGSGNKTIVFLHAQTVTMEDWDYLYPAFQRGRKLLRYDMRGWGLSEKIKDGSITMDQAVEDLHALLDALNIKEKVVLVGGASGANVGLVFAMKYPERVTAVATFSGSINLNPKPRTTPAAGETSKNTSSEASNVDRYAGVYPVALRTDPEKWARFIGMNKTADPASGRAWSTMTAAYDFVPVLPKITVPTLIVGTSLFPSRTMDFMRQVAQAIPKGEFVEIKSSHFAEFQSPELAIPVLQAFLKKVGG